MTLETLRRLSGWVGKIAAATDQVSEELKAQLAKAESVRDPLGLHIYQARIAYRKTQAADKTKAGSRAELSIHMSYTKAQQLGYDGSLKMWTHLMLCGKNVEPDTR